MPAVTIDGRKVEVEDGTTILKAARKLGIEIPVFCYHDGLPVAANCRMCLVEVKGAPKLMPSCEVVVRDGMEVFTTTPAVIGARRSALEFMLLNHPIDCPICDQAGECMLQDQYFQHSSSPSRSQVPKVRKAKAVPLGPNVMLDRERCINCTRCVRFTREVSRTRMLAQVQRGNKTEVSVFPGTEFDDPYSLCTVDLCPVGALTSRDFRFKERSWRLSHTDVVCPECSTGCNLVADSSRGKLLRLRPRPNPDVNRWWACDMGRLAFHTFESGRAEAGALSQDGVQELTTAEVGAEAAGAQVARVLGQGRRVVLVASCSASLEELMSAFAFASHVLGENTVYIGARPDGPADDLLLSADRNANRAGLTRLARSMGFRVREAARLFDDGYESSNLGGLVCLGSDFPLPRLPEGARLDSAVVLTPVLDDVASKATALLPIPAHYERTGHYVSSKGLVQRSDKVIEPPEGTLSVYALLSIIAANCGKSLGLPIEPDGAAAGAAMGKEAGDA